MTRQEIIKNLRYKAENIKTHMMPQVFSEAADMIENENKNVKEDFQDWIVRNWETVEDEISKTMIEFSKVYLFNDQQFHLSDTVDRDDLIESISTAIKEGLLNVIATYSADENQGEGEK